MPWRRGVLAKLVSTLPVGRQRRCGCEQFGRYGCASILQPLLQTQSQVCMGDCEESGPAVDVSRGHFRETLPREATTQSRERERERE